MDIPACVTTVSYGECLLSLDSVIGHCLTSKDDRCNLKVGMSRRKASRLCDKVHRESIVDFQFSTLGCIWYMAHPVGELLSGINLQH
jgi:hypothetical protein